MDDKPTTSTTEAIPIKHHFFSNCFQRQITPKSVPPMSKGTTINANLDLPINTPRNGSLLYEKATMSGNQIMVMTSSARRAIKR